MQITATGLGKRFQRDWIFRGLTRTFEPGSATAVLGPNGAGKSTLLNTFSGQLLPTEGTLTYSLAGHALAVEDVPRHLAYAAPYLELLEELTLLEMLQFHTQFKQGRMLTTDRSAAPRVDRREGRCPMLRRLVPSGPVRETDLRHGRAVTARMS